MSISLRISARAALEERRRFSTDLPMFLESLEISEVIRMLREALVLADKDLRLFSTPIMRDSPLRTAPDTAPRSSARLAFIMAASIARPRRDLTALAFTTPVSFFILPSNLRSLRTMVEWSLAMRRPKSRLALRRESLMSRRARRVWRASFLLTASWARWDFAMAEYSWEVLRASMREAWLRLRRMVARTLLISLL